MENPHRNHRARLRARFLSSGLSDFAPHNVLELLLFFSLPRRDTNPLAHALLARFLRVGEVIGAKREDLLSVEGVGEATAAFLAAFSALGKAAGRPRPKGISLATAERLGSFLDCLLAEAEDQEAAVLFLDNDLCLLSGRRLNGVTAHSARLSPTALLEEALLCHAPIAVFAHKHADGLCLPSAEDLDLARLLRNAFAAAGVTLLEHVLVGGGRYTTLLHRHSGSCRTVLAKEDSDGEEEAALLSALLRAARLPDTSRELIRTYGSLSSLVAASPARHRYCGTDARTATLLLLVGAVEGYCVAERPVPSVSERTALGEYLSALLRPLGEEGLLALFFDKRGKHLKTETLAVGSVGEAPFSMRRLTEAALFAGADSAVLCHNHPLGRAEPSEEDRAVTALASEALLGIGVTLLGHYIVAEGGAFSIL